MTLPKSPAPALPKPRSLMGQMLLAVAVALLVVQGIGAGLIYTAQRQRFEGALLNDLAFRIAMENRGVSGMLRANRPRGPFGGPPRKLAIEYATVSPLRAGEGRDRHAESELRRILASQGITPSTVQVFYRGVTADPVALDAVERRTRVLRLGAAERRRMLTDAVVIAAVQTPGSPSWMVARARTPPARDELLYPLLLQTVTIYVVLMAVIGLILRRITRPLKLLTRRVGEFAASQDASGQIAPEGPEDTRSLIAAHNAMESRIIALLDEKDVMLGAIGHDLKTPLAALRVRIESVESETERARMARTIEDIVHTLDDILSLARVGRPSDPRERTELSALVAQVVEEYEDMGEPVAYDEFVRVALSLRPTWLRRALRNLIGNALRYGQVARVKLAVEGREAVVTIDDDGPGIPEASITAMMDPFTRGDPSRNSETGGAGLGLALARAIADQHGGSLRLANRKGTDGAVAGLTATLRLPVDRG